MKAVGSVEIPQEAFMAILSVDDEQAELFLPFFIFSHI